MVIQEALAEVLGSYRAENLPPKELLTLYAEPKYFPELLGPRACFLQGGRGTGKTTVLRYLSYESLGTGIEVGPQPFHGLYMKFERSEISAFRLAGQDEEYWNRAFSHYLNLKQCSLLTNYFNSNYSNQLVDRNIYETFLNSLGINEFISTNALQVALRKKLVDLQIAVNNAQDTPDIVLSVLSVPTKLFIESMGSISGFNEKPVAFLLDEFEILEDYQQRVVNTLVKQANHEITYKIGLRPEGLRERFVMGGGEELRTPADYALISIEDELSDSFEEFAQTVIKTRLQKLSDMGFHIPIEPSVLFPSLDLKSEANLLGVSDLVSKESLRSNDVPDSLDDFDVFFAHFLAQGKQTSFELAIHEIGNNTSRSKNWKNNYGYASLFAIRKSIAGTRKYYCGWKTYIALADGNVRFLLQLVSHALFSQLRVSSVTLSQVEAKIQTESAYAVAQEILRDTEGISKSGSRLMKLILALGQVFHQLARDPGGHAPEVTQFELSDEANADQDKLDQVRSLLKDGVMHLALVKSTGTKLGGAADTRSFDYMLHPIFSAFFKYSYRRKRKMGLSIDEVLGLIEDHKPTISKILDRHNRSTNYELPSQMELFGGFLADSE